MSEPSFPGHGAAGSPGAPGAHGQPDESLFPRELTTDLVARSEDPGPRGLGQLLVIAAGITALALGLPSERLWAEGAFVAGLESGVSISGMPLRLVHGALHGLLRSEAAAFVIAAAGLGLAYVLLVRLLLYIGFDRGCSLTAGGLGVAMPVVWLGGTTALGVTPELVGTVLVVRAAFGVDRAPRSSRLSLMVCLAVAWLLAPGNAFLALAGARAGRGRGTLAIGLLGLVLVIGSFVEGRLALPGVGELGARLLWPLLGIGVGWAGLVALRSTKRAEEESPPPAWLGLVLMGSLLSALFAPLSAGPAAAGIVVVAAIGLTDLLQRQQDAAGARGLGLLLAAVQVLSTGAVLWVRATKDPLTEWRAGAQQALDPGDLVLTTDPAHHHLLVRRYGLEAAPAALVQAPDLARAWSEGRRVVVVLPPGPEPEALRGFLDEPNLLVLENDGRLR